MITGETLCAMRKLRNKKQDVVAKALGISQPSYCALEKSPCINGQRYQSLLYILDFTEEQVEELKRLFPPSNVD